MLFVVVTDFCQFMGSFSTTWLYWTSRVLMKIIILKKKIDLSYCIIRVQISGACQPTIHALSMWGYLHKTETLSQGAKCGPTMLEDRHDECTTVVSLVMLMSLKALHVVDGMPLTFWYHNTLRLPHRNDAKITKICNLWTFWHVIQLIEHLFKIQKKAFLPNAP